MNDKEKERKKMDNNTFTYRYSAARQKEVEAIRAKYIPREPDAMERLRALDLRVQSAGMIEALSLGIVGLLIFGIAMCFGLSVFGQVFWPAIPFGIIGVTLMVPAYPLYRHLHERQKEALTPEILRLSQELIEK